MPKCSNCGKYSNPKPKIGSGQYTLIVPKGVIWPQTEIHAHFIIKEDAESALELVIELGAVDCEIEISNLQVAA